MTHLVELGLDELGLDEQSFRIDCNNVGWNVSVDNIIERCKVNQHCLQSCR